MDSHRGVPGSVSLSHLFSSPGLKAAIWILLFHAAFIYSSLLPLLIHGPGWLGNAKRKEKITNKIVGVG